MIWDSTLPRYQALAASIADRIGSGEYALGALIRRAGIGCRNRVGLRRRFGLIERFALFGSLIYGDRSQTSSRPQQTQPFITVVPANAGTQCIPMKYLKNYICQRA